MFSKQVTLFNILGFKVYLNFSWVLLALLITWSLATGYFPSYYPGLSQSTYWWIGAAGALGLFGSIVFHELAHSLIARRHGLPIRSITLFIFGGVAQMDEEPPSQKSELLVAIAGPISSFSLSALCHLIFDLGYRYDVPIPVLAVIGFLAFANSLLGAFNVIPAFPLDGGRVLRAALWQWKRNFHQATRWASRVGSLSGLTLMLSGLFHVVTGNFMVGIWWFVVGHFLREAAVASYDRLVARTTSQEEQIRRLMTANPATVSADLPVEALVEEHFYRSLHHLYPVMKDSRLIGCISSKQIAGIPRDQWNRLTVGDLATPCSKDNTVSGNTEALEALSLMNRTGNSRLMVMEGERLAGIITLKDLLKLLALKLNLEGNG